MTVPILGAVDPLVYVGGGTIVSLVSLVIVLLTRMVRMVPSVYDRGYESQQRTISALEKTVGGLRSDLVEGERRQRKCDRNQVLLIQTIVRMGGEVPAAIWEEPDDGTD